MSRHDHCQCGCNRALSGPQYGFYVVPKEGNAAYMWRLFGLIVTLYFFVVIERFWLSVKAIDVTNRVRVDGRSLQLTEANLRSFGLRAATEGDLSSPGLVLALR